MTRPETLDVLGVRRGQVGPRPRVFAAHPPLMALPRGRRRSRWRLFADHTAHELASADTMTLTAGTRLGTYEVVVRRLARRPALSHQQCGRRRDARADTDDSELEAGIVIERACGFRSTRLSRVRASKRGALPTSRVVPRTPRDQRGRASRRPGSPLPSHRGSSARVDSENRRSGEA